MSALPAWITAALTRHWRLEDIRALLEGPARYGDGMLVPCCESCGQPEYVDGLIATEAYGEGVVGGYRCPGCL